MTSTVGARPSRDERRHERAPARRPRVGDVGDEAAVATLRGATTEVDPRRVRAVLRTVSLIALAALIAVLYAAGATKNAQISELRANPLVLAATVTTCRGQLGGSGSNGVGYSCAATYVVSGSRYTETLPGSALRERGSRVDVAVASDDPGLLSTPALVARERASIRVFVLPTALLALLAALCGWRLASRRRTLARRWASLPS